MFGASHFQKKLSEKIDFWVSYSNNKFLTINWLHVDWFDNKWLQLITLTSWPQVDWLTNWLKVDKWLQVDYKLLQAGYKLTASWLQVGYKLATN
jgi:hypothetical protein